MNTNSVIYKYVKKQLGSSWNDDPFGVETKAVKGLTNMSNEKRLSNFVDDLVGQYSKFDGENYTLSLSNIPEDEQGELVSLYMDYTDRETSECVHGQLIAIDNSYTCALLNLLRDDSRENQENFAEITRKNTIIYYSQVLQEIIDEACHSFHMNINNENGYYSYQDSNHDEIHWGKYR